MKIRVKAPLRLGLAGGGTDVSPYSDKFGGCVLNATINMYAHTFIEPVEDGGTTTFCALDLGITEIISTESKVKLDGSLILHKAVYKKIMERYNNGKNIPLKVNTMSDAPPGSGLGSSSTMVVSMLEGYRQLLSLPLGEYEIAALAYEIERVDCGLAGGKQDQYAATFGGFNFMEFYENDRVIVNPLRIRRYIISELEASLVLFFSGASRDSAKIINEQVRSLQSDQRERLEAMHKVKESAYKIKEMIFKADIDGVAEEFKSAWKAKKATSASISNKLIESISDDVMSAGAKSMKVSGAGGGGFVMIFVTPEKRLKVIDALKKHNGTVRSFQFTNEGVYSWTI